MRILIITLFLILSTQISFAQTYPSTCPSEAIGVLNAVGGCAAVDCNRFPAICQKCCTVQETESQVATPQPTYVSYPTPSSNVFIIVGIVITILVIGFIFLRHKKL